MGGDEAGGLWESGVGPIHDESHKKHSVGEILRVEGYDEEGDFASRVVLGVRVCVGEGESGEKGESIEEVACCRLCKS